VNQPVLWEHQIVLVELEEDAMMILLVKMAVVLMMPVPNGV
jgi:hypothetical protein